jgi:hypothetical protein
MYLGFPICRKSLMASDDAVASIVAARREVAGILARSAAGASHQDTARLVSSVTTLQTVCAALDQKLAPLLTGAGAPALEAASWAWRECAAFGRLETAEDGASIPPCGSLLHCAKTSFAELQKMPQLVPPSLQLWSRPHKQEDVGGAGESLVVRLDGEYTAMIDVVGVPATDGEGIGAWLPTRVSIGPSNDPMELASDGASHPAAHHVFRDLDARAGVLLAGLNALSPRRRLHVLLLWLSSLHPLFECACAGCGAVFPPYAIVAADMLPPTARCAHLLPYHPVCYAERFGRSAEADFLEAAKIKHCFGNDVTDGKDVGKAGGGA